MSQNCEITPCPGVLHRVGWWSRWLDNLLFTRKLYCISSNNCTVGASKNFLEVVLLWWCDIQSWNKNFYHLYLCAVNYDWLCLHICGWTYLFDNQPWLWIFYTCRFITRSDEAVQVGNFNQHICVVSKNYSLPTQSISHNGFSLVCQPVCVPCLFLISLKTDQ